MSAVIKSALAPDLRIRGLAAAPVAPAPSAEAQVIAGLEARLEGLMTELAARDQEIDELKAAVPAARAEGVSEGHEAGRKAVEDRIEARLVAVSAAAAEAASAFDRRLEGLQAMAGGLAALALSRIVGETTDRSELVVDTVQRAVGGLFAGAVLVVEVSPADFADVAAFEGRLPADCEVRLVSELASGGCRLRLRLGEADLDLDGQVDRLRLLLDPVEGRS